MLKKIIQLCCLGVSAWLGLVVLPVYAYQIPGFPVDTSRIMQQDPLRTGTLSEALQYGTPDQVLTLLEKGADANGTINNMDVPYLLFAFQRGDLETAELLLKHGADIYFNGKHGRNLLEIALSFPNKSMLEFVLLNSSVKEWQRILKPKAVSISRLMNSQNISKLELLLQHGWDIRQIDNNGNTALINAVRNQNLLATRTLLQHKADMFAKNNNGYDALYYALNHKHVRILRELLRFGMNPHLRYTKKEQTALMLAVIYKDYQAVELLLNSDANVHDVNKEGENSLVLALQERHYRADIAELLLRYDADPNSYDENGQSVLSMVVQRQCYFCVDLLLKHGAKVNDGGKHRKPGTDYFSRPPLFWAVEKGDIPMATKLLKAGADIHLRNKKDLTNVMYIAARNLAGQKNMIPFLAKHGVRVNIHNRDYWTPLISATSSSDISVIKALLKASADVNMSNGHGWTPLMAAAQAGDSEKVKLLLKHGAKVNAKTRRGWTALSDAKRHGNFDVVEILLEAGGVDPKNVRPKTRNDRGKLKIDIKVLDK